MVINIKSETYPSRTPPGKSACTRAPNGIILTSLI